DEAPHAHAGLRSLGAASVLEAVADAPDGLDAGPGVAELLPQGDDLHVDGTVGDGGDAVVDRLDDLLPREHPAGTGGEVGEQPELGGGERDELAVDGGLESVAVDDDAAGFDDAAVAGVGVAAEDGLDP